MDEERENEKPAEILNKKAIEVLERIRKKNKWQRL